MIKRGQIVRGAIREYLHTNRDGDVHIDVLARRVDFVSDLCAYIERALDYAATAETPPVMSAVVVLPGDTLLVQVPPDIDERTADEYRADFRERLPNVDVVLVAANGMGVVRNNTMTPEGGS